MMEYNKRHKTNDYFNHPKEAPSPTPYAAPVQSRGVEFSLHKMNELTDEINPRDSRKAKIT